MVLWAVILPLLLLGPALGTGYVLSYDMVWVPDLALRSDFLGWGTALPRAVPSDAVVAVLDELFPGMLLQKVVLYGGLVLAGLGCARLVGQFTLGGLVAVSFAIWNPFVIERLWIGHWPVLLGYAVVPWLVLAGRRARLERRIPLMVWFLLPLGSLSASAGLVSAVALLVSAADRSSAGSKHVWARLLAVCLAVNAPWLVAGCVHAGDTLSTKGFDVFGLRAEGSLPAPLAALGMGGIWNGEVVPTSREGFLAWVSLVVVLGLAAAGGRPWWRRVGDPRLIVLWAVGYGLAVVPWLIPAAAEWFGSHVPGGGLLRDGTRSLALCLPLLVSLVASGAENLAGRVTPVLSRAALGSAFVLLPLAVMTDAAWGLGGALRPTDFPTSYAGARSALPASLDDVLVLPFSSYRAPDWNDGRKVLDPLGRYLRPNYVVNDQLSISGRIVQGEDRRVPAVQAALRLESPDERAAALGQLGIRFVARDGDAPGSGDPAYDAQVAGDAVFGDGQLEVIEITAPVNTREAATSVKLGMLLAWGSLIGTIVLGFSGLGIRACRRWLLARKQVLEFPAEG